MCIGFYRFFVFMYDCDLYVVVCVVYDDLLNVLKDDFFWLVVIADAVSELFAG